MKFTEEQLDWIGSPWLDEQYVEDRKGRSQVNFIIHVREGLDYWCSKAQDFKQVPAEFAGTYILDETHDSEYMTWNDVKRSDQWHKAVEREVCELKWVIA